MAYNCVEGNPFPVDVWSGKDYNCVEGNPFPVDVWAGKDGL